MNSIIFQSGGIATYPRGATFGPRLSTSFEFVWIIQGNATAHFDTNKIPAPSGTLLLSRPGMIDYYEWDIKNPTIHGFFHFLVDDEFIKEFPPMENWPVSKNIDSIDLQKALVKYCIEYLKTKSIPVAEHKKRAVQCAELLLRLFITPEDLKKAQHPKENPLLIGQAELFLAQLCRKSPVLPITLADFAEKMCITKGHLCHLFKLHFQKSPLEYYRDMRLEKAKWLLTRSNLIIKEIAQETGFAHQYHFSRCFREKYKVSPREFRIKLTS